MPLLSQRAPNAAGAPAHEPTPKAESKGNSKALAGAGFEAQEAALAPPAAGTSLPESTQELESNPSFIVTPAGRFVGDAIPAEIGSLVMSAIRAEGVSDAKTLEAALKEYVDQGTVWVFKVQRPGGALTWVRFYAGDTEVGGLFEGGALAAIVSDGAITSA